MYSTKSHSVRFVDGQLRGSLNQPRLWNASDIIVHDVNNNHKIHVFAARAYSVLSCTQRDSSTVEPL